MGTFNRTALCMLMGLSLLPALALAAGADVSGQIRSAWVQRPVADTGPLAQANGVQAGTVGLEPSATTVQAELRAAGSMGAIRLNAVATLQARAPQG